MAKKLDKDACKDPKCGHPKRYHAIPEAHDLGTSHCTNADNNVYCECQKYEGE